MNLVYKLRKTPEEENLKDIQQNKRSRNIEKKKSSSELLIGDVT